MDVYDAALLVEEGQLGVQEGRRGVSRQAADAVVAQPVPELKDELFPLRQYVARGVGHLKLDLAALDVDLHARVAVASPGLDLDGERAHVVPGPCVAGSDTILQAIAAGQRLTF